MKNMFVKVLTLGMCVVSGMASAQTIGNAGAAQLQRDAVSLLAQGQISTQDSQQFLKRNRFDVEDVQWQKNGQVIHGPYYIPDGDEEGENVPYAFAVNQGRSIVGIGGWLPAPLLTRLQKTPNVRCQKIDVQNGLWLCAHASATAQTKQVFVKELRYLAQHSN